MSLNGGRLILGYVLRDAVGTAVRLMDMLADNRQIAVITVGFYASAASGGASNCRRLGFNPSSSALARATSESM